MTQGRESVWGLRLLVEGSKNALLSLRKWERQQDNGNLHPSHPYQWLAIESESGLLGINCTCFFKPEADPVFPLLHVSVCLPAPCPLFCLFPSDFLLFLARNVVIHSPLPPGGELLWGVPH